MRGSMVNLKVMVTAAALGTALCAGCSAGGGFTTSPSLFKPTTSGGNNNGSTSTPVSGSGSTLITSPGGGTGGGGDTDLHLPGGGGGGGTPVQGSGYSPAIATPATESFSNDADPGDDAATAWLKDCLETLPNPRTSGSGVFQNDSLQNWAYAIFEGVNAARAAEGLQELKYEPHLEMLAQAHARDMGLRDYFSHDSPDGLLMWDRWMAVHVPFVYWAGENAAAGQETAAEVVSQWLSSPGHHKNMMHDSAEYCGVGVYFDASDSSMPVKVIMEYAEFRDDPATSDWYELGDIYK
jgi:uncharacterized protein YkwD